MIETSASPVPPFSEADGDRRAIWEMLVRRDIDAFLQQDWAMVAGDFVESGFFGIDACGSNVPDQWKPRFATLAAYREDWLRQAVDAARTPAPDQAFRALHQATSLTPIDASGEPALANKTFECACSMWDGLAPPRPRG